MTKLQESRHLSLHRGNRCSLVRSCSRSSSSCCDSVRSSCDRGAGSAKLLQRHRRRRGRQRRVRWKRRPRAAGGATWRTRDARLVRAARRGEKRAASLSHAFDVRNRRRGVCSRECYRGGTRVPCPGHVEFPGPIPVSGDRSAVAACRSVACGLGEIDRDCGGVTSSAHRRVLQPRGDRPRARRGRSGSW